MKCKNLFFLCATVISLCSCGKTDVPDEVTLTNSRCNVYLGSAEANGFCDIYTINGVKEIPYILINDVEFWLNFLMFSVESGKVTTQVKESTYTWTNTLTNQSASLNVETSVFTYSDYNGFMLTESAPTYINAVIEKEYDSYLKVKEGSNKYNKENKATSLSVSLNDYSLGVKSVDSKYYLDLNVLLNLYKPDNKIIYNGKCIIKNEPSEMYDEKGNLTAYGNLFYTTDISFNDASKHEAYNVFCMNVDTHYGNRDILLNNKKLDAVLKEKNLKSMMYDAKDAKAFNVGLHHVIYTVLNDYGHTWMRTSATGIFDKDEIIDPIQKDAFEVRVATDENGIAEARRNNQEYYEKGKYGNLTYYDEYANAFIFSFNKFTDSLETKDDVDSTINKVIEANKFLQENKSVKNVIIDLSLNGGGADVGELFVEAWVKGEANQYLRSCGNGVYAETTYLADVNRDGVFDEKDTIKDRNILVITSLATYSNGNVLASELVGCKNVTVVGNDTGGGSCNTSSMSSTLGNIYNYSCMGQAMYADGTSFERGVLITNPNNRLTNYNDYVSYKELVNKYLPK